MNVERLLRMIAGAFVALSVILSFVANEYRDYFLYFSIFVGLNLFQSAFTNWCPMMTFLRKLGVRDAGASCES